MKPAYAAALILLLVAPRPLFAQADQSAGEAGNAGSPSWDGAGGDYLPRVDSVPSDWAARFATDEARTNFKLLREYRVEKQAALVEARAQRATFESLMDQVRLGSGSSAGYLSQVSGLLSGASGDSVEIRNSLAYEFDQKLGYTTPGIVPVTALRDLQRRLADEDSTSKRRQSAIERSFRLSRENLRTLEGDLRRAEAAIDAALAPEIRSQQFRTWVSAFFSGLIAIMIIAFFATIYLRSGNDVGALLLSDGGLQFVTIFVLIIAIILFGILNILEGRELAAILSGIAGYILGRGARMKADASEPALPGSAASPPSPPAPGSPGAAPAVPAGAIIPVAGTIADPPAALRPVEESHGENGNRVTRNRRAPAKTT
jgi:hypothetical protein